MTTLTASASAISSIARRPAAARTALVKHTLRALAYEDAEPANVLSRLNRIVTRVTREGFVPRVKASQPGRAPRALGPLA
ncbi:MAG: SpoIIE family protein phosphatase [Armatimonadetes bacterium]|nr:SpoIIE family protein phosphatase [Armatimonadota bacterium]